MVLEVLAELKGRGRELPPDNSLHSTFDPGGLDIPLPLSFCRHHGLLHGFVEVQIIFELLKCLPGLHSNHSRFPCIGVVY